MIQSRQIAKDLGLQMKIGDVEYQGDGNKAIFYYIADERVDFRQLIKVLADTFHVRIEMKQIGARQEAGRIGGTGPCGRELCCATWMKNFVSVSTNAARLQDISLNPQKLAGMCAKLKCCLNYEVDDYVEAGRKMPARDIILQTIDSDWYLFKTDILAGLVTYSTDKSIAANLITISAERARAVIEMNRRGEKPEALDEGDAVSTQDRPADLLADADISRFDKAKKKKKAKNRPNRQPAAQQREPKQPKQREQKQPRPATADRQQQPNQPQQAARQQPQQPKPQGQPQHSKPQHQPNQPQQAARQQPQQPKPQGQPQHSKPQHQPNQPQQAAAQQPQQPKPQVQPQQSKPQQQPKPQAQPNAEAQK